MKHFGDFFPPTLDIHGYFLERERSNEAAMGKGAHSAPFYVLKRLKRRTRRAARATSLWELARTKQQSRGYKIIKTET